MLEQKAIEAVISTRIQVQIPGYEVVKRGYLPHKERFLLTFLAALPIPWILVIIQADLLFGSARFLPGSIVWRRVMLLDVRRLRTVRRRTHRSLRNRLLNGEIETRLR